jgi:hypothetical protein
MGWLPELTWVSTGGPPVGRAAYPETPFCFSDRGKPDEWGSQPDTG